MKSPLHRFVRVIRRTLLVSLVLGAATVVKAAPAKIFVANYGNDANSGSPASPKRAFQAAHDAVAAGGQIVVLDTAGYGTLNINKSISVTVPPGVNGFITTSGSANGVSVSAGSFGPVTLSGLIIEGGGAEAGGDGILADSVDVLRVEDCTVRDFSVGI